MSEEDNQPTLNFHITFSLDRKEFFRRACHSCGLQFKTKAGQDELASMLQPMIHQMGLEIGENPAIQSSDTKPASHVFCPYCGDNGETSKFLTEVFSKYLERLLIREYVLPLYHKMMSGFADSFGARRNPSRGFLSFEFSINYERELLPPRPISGPELPDMRIVDLICCKESIKVIEGWNFPIYCTYCGQISVLQ